GTYYTLVDNPRGPLDRIPPNNGQVSFTSVPFLPLIPVNPSTPLPPVCGPGVPGSIDPTTGVKSAGNCTTFSPNAVQPNLKTPTVEEWNFAIERQVAPNTSLTLGYTGSHGYHNGAASDPNQIPSQFCTNAAGCTSGGMITKATSASSLLN